MTADYNDYNDANNKDDLAYNPTHDHFTIVEDDAVECCHAPPVVWAFLGRNKDERARGVKQMAGFAGGVCGRGW
jgi:hypothetical protein